MIKTIKKIIKLFSFPPKYQNLVGQPKIYTNIFLMYYDLEILVSTEQVILSLPQPIFISA